MSGLCDDRCVYESIVTTLQTVSSADLIINYILIGSYVDKPAALISRGRNHQFPIIAENILCGNAAQYFTSNYKQYISQLPGKQLQITQYIHLIDGEYMHRNGGDGGDGGGAAADSGDIKIPSNLITLIDRIAASTAEHSPQKLIKHGKLQIIIDNGDYVCNTIFNIIPFDVSPNILQTIQDGMPILNIINKRQLILLFDFTGRVAVNQDILHLKYPNMYSIASDCMMNYDDLITHPLIDYLIYCAGCELQWWQAPKHRLTLLLSHQSQYHARYLTYYYAENHIPALRDMLPWLRDKMILSSIYGSATIAINDINITYDNREIIHRYIIPLIKYRCAGNERLNHMIFYLNSLCDIRANHFAYNMFITARRDMTDREGDPSKTVSKIVPKIASKMALKSEVKFIELIIADIEYSMSLIS